MSFVVSVMYSGRIIMAGDTQLNDDNGPISLTGMKVFPVDQATLVGMTGIYKDIITCLNEMTNEIGRLTSFDKKVAYIKSKICVPSLDNDVVVAGLENGKTKFIAFSTKEKYDTAVEIVDSGAAIRVLMPPGLKEEVCRPYITSLDGLEQQVINCITAVSRMSDTVNDKICGFDLTMNGMRRILHNIKYEDIDYRIMEGNL